MPFSSPSLRFAALLVAAALASQVRAADNKVSHENILLDAASSEVDYKKNTVEFKDIVISQGDIKVEAKHAEAEATGLNFKTGVWTFSGDVRIHVEKRGNLRSDQAVISARIALRWLASPMNSSSSRVSFGAVRVSQNACSGWSEASAFCW